MSDRCGRLRYAMAALGACCVIGCAADVANPTGAPDRVLDGFLLTAGPYHAGDHLLVTFVVRNAGPSIASAVTGAIVLAADVTLTGSPITLATFPVPAILPNQSAGITSASVDLPETLAAGSYYLGLKIGTDPKVPEPSLANNTIVAPLIVDLELSALPNHLGVTGPASFCAIASSGTSYCWGDNQAPLFGFSSNLAVNSTPVSTPAPPLTRLARGGNGGHLCGITATGAALCWGRNDTGDIGNATIGNGTTGAPTFSPIATVTGGITWTDLNVSELGSCGVSTSAVGYCWGSNLGGAVGSRDIPVGDRSDASTLVSAPHPIDGRLQFLSVVGGWQHACGIVVTGEAYCWGNNTSGEVGVGLEPNADAVHRSPDPIAGGLHWIQLSLGAKHSCGISRQHDAYCWGLNNFGQLGDGTTTNRSAPMLVAGGHKFAVIATSSGFDDVLQPGHPSNAPQGGIGHTCALDLSGRAYCWGFNEWGQLGDGTTTDRHSPAEVVSPTPIGFVSFERIAAGGNATCAMNSDRIWCWGANAHGQLGNGSTINSPVPVAVRPPFGSSP